jgi:hypothetical protein
MQHYLEVNLLNLIASFHYTINPKTKVQRFRDEKKKKQSLVEFKFVRQVSFFYKVTKNIDT